MANGVKSFGYAEENSTDEGRGVERVLNGVNKGICCRAERKESELVGRDDGV